LGKWSDNSGGLESEITEHQLGAKAVYTLFCKLDLEGSSIMNLVAL
jgi:hypothetical protein